MRIMDYIQQDTELLASMIVYPVVSRTMEGESIMWNFNTMDDKKGLHCPSYSKNEVIRLAKNILNQKFQK